MKILDIESIHLNTPLPQKDKPFSATGRYTSYSIVRVRTDEGITGYGFRGIDPNELERSVKPKFVGQDPCAVERHLENGIGRFPGLEHALWDIIGKAAGLPVASVLGGYQKKVKCYVTCVWPGKPDQSDQAPETQAKHAKQYLDHGFKAIKIRSWSPAPLDDVKAVEAIRNEVGDEMEIMIDRTAHAQGTVWSYDTALMMARELKRLNVAWLEEPLARDDLDGLARLTAETEITITGGEGDYGTEIFKEFLVRKCFNIVQPDAYTCGGLLTIKKISAMAEAFGVPCILHGSHSLGLAGPLQIVGALPNCPWMEIALVSPPLMPWEQWEPAHALLKEPLLYTIKDGYIDIPQEPGLGLELDEDALEKYRVR